MFGTWLAAERERRGWSKSELARRAGLTQPAITILENGKRRHPNKATSEALARAFGISVAEMLEVAYATANLVTHTPTKIEQAQARIAELEAQIAQLQAAGQPTPYPNGRRMDGGAIGYSHPDEVAADTEEIA